MKNIVVFFLLILPAISASAHVNLTYPQGGGSFDPGTNVTIEWEVVIPHETQNWDLYFSPDGGATWEPIQLDLPVESLNYAWTVPAQATTMGMVRVVQDNVGLDYSDESGLFTITGSVGLDEQESTPGYAVYPNPAIDRIIISSENSLQGTATVNLQSLEGRAMKTTEISDPGYRTEFQLDIGFLPPGVYLLTIDRSGERFTRKVIIK